MAGAKARGLLWGLGVAAAAAAAALALPHLARHVPWAAERWIDAAVGFAPGKPCDAHPRATAALETLVRRIYPVAADDGHFPLTVAAIHGATVNAFATLGGHVYVYAGLIEQAHGPEELAGVLAHEIEHVRNRHIIQGAAVSLLTSQGLRVALPGGGPIDAGLARVLLNLQFSRTQEAQADELGLERLRLAQVDASGFEQFFARAEAQAAPPPFLSNHPSNESRRALAARSRGYPVRPVLGADEWQALAAICR